MSRACASRSAPYMAVVLPDDAIGSDQTNKFVLVGEDGTVNREHKPGAA